MEQTYAQKRKALGLCVRCPQPGYVRENGVRSPVCERHFHERKSLRGTPLRERDGLVGARQEPREPYVADYLHDLPPLPATCPRCAAQLLPCLMAVEFNYVEAVYCYACSFTVDQFAWKNKLEAA
jgi:hypothetical protein